MKENICKQCDQPGVNIQNIQTAHTTKYFFKKNQKLGRRPKWHFSKDV